MKIVKDTILVVVWPTLSPSLIVPPGAAVGPHEGICSWFTSTSDPSHLVVTSLFIVQFVLHEIVDSFVGDRSKMASNFSAVVFSI